MSKYELTLSPDYVPSWTVTDAIRELFQNALDQQTVASDNHIFFSYEPAYNRISIGNKRSVLSINSLLLGSTTKSNDANTIGQFGEGYKIATLVLLRLGKQVTFYNYGAKEVWRPRLVDSRRYKSKVLTFSVDKKHIWESVPDNNLTIVVEGITPLEHDVITMSNLHLQDLYDFTETPMGRILHDKAHKGKIFVNGLFVCEHSTFARGYDVKPQYIKLDRDRKLITNFDLEWLSARMWASTKSEEISELSANNAPDVHYVSHSISNAVNVCLRAHKDFEEAHGSNAVPVNTQEELETVPAKYKAVLVSESYKYLITNSPSYVEPIVEPTKKLSEKFNDWLNTNNLDITGSATAGFLLLLNELKELEENL